MKKWLLLLGVICLYASLHTPAHAAPLFPLKPKTDAAPQPTQPQAINPLQLNFHPEDKMQQFLDQEKKQLSRNFPYRINLFEKGQTNKNNAGVRITETARQLFSDNAALLFYYQLYNHSMHVPHWHANATEVGAVLSGRMRVTIWQGTGETKVFTVDKGETWMIPKAALHALENIGNGPLTFFVAYNSPNAAERDFSTASVMLPDALLERATDLNSDEIAAMKKSTINSLSHYDPSAKPQNVNDSSPFSGNFNTVKPLFQSNLGSVKRIDGITNPEMQAMALQQTILKPGAIRVPHWYVAGDDILFVYKGSAYFTMMNNEGRVYKALLKPGDVVFIPVGAFHTYLNTGKENLEIYEAFNACENLGEISLQSGAQHFSVGAFAGAMGLSNDAIKKVIKKKVSPYIISFYP